MDFLAGDHAFSNESFHLGVIVPSLTTGAKNTVTIRSVPWALADWKSLRENEYSKYVLKKEEWSNFLIDIVEKYFIPDLRKHIVVKDISSPATYQRYSGSPTGSLYDMSSLVTQFGPKRLSMKTPIKNLYQPKFSHGLYGTMMNGVQVVDLLMERKFNNGNSLFAPNNHLNSPNGQKTLFRIFLRLHSALEFLPKAQKPMNIHQLHEPLIIDGIHELRYVGRCMKLQGPDTDAAHPGEAASYKSEFYLAQDAQNIYLSAIFYQDYPVKASIQDRDNLSKSDDCFVLLLDSYNDKRTGYGFWINPLGTQADFRINDDGRNIDTNWDTEWESAVSIQDDRWTVEIRLPFSSIRYHSGYS